MVSKLLLDGNSEIPTSAEHIASNRCHDDLSLSFEIYIYIYIIQVPWLAQLGFAYRYPDRHPVPVSADTGTL